MVSPLVRSIAISLLFLLSIATAQAVDVGQPAPDWEISAWLNAEEPIGSLADQRGRVVLIHFFQLWCPGCNNFSIPLFDRWHEKYGERDDVRILSIHTVFEGHGYQTPDRLRDFVEKNRIAHPVGIDAYAEPDDEHPITMRRYRTGGTPHVVVIDKEGIVRFDRFGGFDAQPVEQFIDELLAVEAEPSAP